MAIGSPSVGEAVPLVTNPASSPSTLTAYPWRAMALVAHDQSHQLADRAGLLDGGQRGATHELALVQLHHPAQVGLVGVDVAAELVAVQRHAGLQPQRVAAAQAARLDAERLPAVDQRVPQAGRRGGASQNSSKPSSPV